MAFLEPNRRNPLFLLQVAACADMTWREEKGMFRLSAKSVRSSFEHAGLRPLDTQRFGFFPPQLLNRSSRWGALEAGLEKVRVLEPILPFLFLGAETPEESAAS